jgi:hypothetical protein
VVEGVKEWCSHGYYLPIQSYGYGCIKTELSSTWWMMNSVWYNTYCNILQEYKMQDPNKQPHFLGECGAEILCI